MRLNYKKSNIPVVLLVVLTITLCFFALLSFSKVSSKAEAEINNFGFLDKIYVISHVNEKGYESSLLEEFDEKDLQARPVWFEKYETTGFLTKERHLIYRVEYIG